MLIMRSVRVCVFVCINSGKGKRVGRKSRQTSVYSIPVACSRRGWLPAGMATDSPRVGDTGISFDLSITASPSSGYLRTPAFGISTKYIV